MLFVCFSFSDKIPFVFSRTAKAAHHACPDAARNVRPSTMNCEIIEVAHVEDATGYPCTREASARCSDCGAHLCDLHSASCEMCQETFCETCLAFHSRSYHAAKKPVAADHKYKKSA
jgi:hypothetical protein